MRVSMRLLNILNLILIIPKCKCNLFVFGGYSFPEHVYYPDSSLALCTLWAFCAFKKFTNEI